jgi:predicted transcriptional regulator
MLLSFKPEWYNLIKDGSKIYEYRRTFPDEEILAYMYVSSPIKMIVGKIHLGKKINLNIWKAQYKEDVSVCERIEDFLTRHTYVMPILSFQMTKEITLTELRKFNPDFTCPQMYYYLENYPDLFEYIRNNAIEMGEKRINSFENVDKEEICRKNYY